MGQVWANQFDNLANREGHQARTGGNLGTDDGKVDAFTCACGTGGHWRCCLRAEGEEPHVRIGWPIRGQRALRLVKTNDLSMSGSSITGGHRQFDASPQPGRRAIDDAERIPDAEALACIYDVLIHEGLSVGTSSGINIAAAIGWRRRWGRATRW